MRIEVTPATPAPVMYDAAQAAAYVHPSTPAEDVVDVLARMAPDVERDTLDAQVRTSLRVFEVEQLDTLLAMAPAIDPNQATDRFPVLTVAGAAGATRAHPRPAPAAPSPWHTVSPVEVTSPGTTLPPYPPAPRHRPATPKRGLRGILATAGAVVVVATGAGYLLDGLITSTDPRPPITEAPATTYPTRLPVPGPAIRVADDEPSARHRATPRHRPSTSAPAPVATATPSTSAPAPTLPAPTVPAPSAPPKPEPTPSSSPSASPPSVPASTVPPTPTIPVPSEVIVEAPPTLP